MSRIPVRFFEVHLFHSRSFSSLSVSSPLACLPRFSYCPSPSPVSMATRPGNPVSPETRCARSPVRLRPTRFGTNVWTNAVSAETRCVQRKHGVSPTLLYTRPCRTSDPPFARSPPPSLTTPSRRSPRRVPATVSSITVGTVHEVDGSIGSNTRSGPRPSGGRSGVGVAPVSRR